MAHAIPTSPEPSTRPTPAEPPNADALFDTFLRKAAEQNGGQAPGLKEWVDLAEGWRIVHALRVCRGNRSAAARHLGIGRRTLYTKMEKLGIEETFQVQGGWRP